MRYYDDKANNGVVIISRGGSFVLISKLDILPDPIPDKANWTLSQLMACKLLSEIGDILRFTNANKLTKFVGIAPVTFPQYIYDWIVRNIDNDISELVFSFYWYKMIYRVTTCEEEAWNLFFRIAHDFFSQIDFKSNI